jgi:hypothetical protein
MARAAKEVIELEEQDLSPLVDALRGLAEQGGWINLTPGVPAEAVGDPDRSLLAFLAGSSRPEAPLATWMPARPGAASAGTLGVLHRRGRLHREGLAALASIPSSWRCTQDHARRGLLFEVPEASELDVAEALVAVVEELATVPTTGRYLAEVFRRG